MSDLDVRITVYRPPVQWPVEALDAWADRVAEDVGAEEALLARRRAERFGSTASADRE